MRSAMGRMGNVWMGRGWILKEAGGVGIWLGVGILVVGGDKTVWYNDTIDENGGGKLRGEGRGQKVLKFDSPWPPRTQIDILVLYEV